MTDFYVTPDEKHESEIRFYMKPVVLEIFDFFDEISSINSSISSARFFRMHSLSVTHFILQNDSLFTVTCLVNSEI